MKAYLENLYSKNPKFSVAGLLFTAFIVLVLTVFNWPLYSQPLEVADLNYSYEASENDLDPRFSAEIKDDTVEKLVFSSPAEIELALHTPQNESLKTASGPFGPFSALIASEKNSNKTLLLWHEKYQEEGIHQREDTVYTPFTQSRDEWETGRVTREYLIRPDNFTINLKGWMTGNRQLFRYDRVEPGKYTINDSLQYSRSEERQQEEQLNYSVEFELARKR